MYHLRCDCGAPVTTESAVFICRVCWRTGRIEWASRKLRSNVLVCSKCHAEVPDKHLACTACLEREAKRAVYRDMQAGRAPIDLFAWNDTAHIYAPQGKVVDVEPKLKRFALCGVQPRRTDRIQTRSRATLDSQPGLCTECVRALANLAK